MIIYDQITALMNILLLMDGAKWKIESKCSKGGFTFQKASSAHAALKQ